MADILADIFCFARALWREWRVILTGSSLVAILAILALVGQRPIPQNLAWLILGVTFIWASFLAWRKEKKSAPQLGTEQPMFSDQRIFIDLPLSELIQPYEERTTIEADRLMSAYKGKWLKVNGKIRQVSESFNGGGHEVLLSIGRIHLSLEFSLEWDERILILRKGQSIRAAGKIRHIGDDFIHLEKCEMLPSAPEQHP